MGVEFNGTSAACGAETWQSVPPSGSDESGTGEGTCRLASGGWPGRTHKSKASELKEVVSLQHVETIPAF
jgi:hypothetical protein